MENHEGCRCLDECPNQMTCRKTNFVAPSTVCICANHGNRTDFKNGWE